MDLTGCDRTLFKHLQLRTSITPCKTSVQITVIRYKQLLNFSFGVRLFFKNAISQGFYAVVYGECEDIIRYDDVCREGTEV